MASLFRRRRVTYQLPGGKHRTPDGKRVTKNTPGAVRVDLGRSDIYYGRYKTTHGFETVPLCADKTASKQMLAKLVTDAKLAEHGLGDKFDEHRRRPLADHLEDYRRHLEAKGNTAKHVRLTVGRIREALDGCRFVTLADLDAAAVAEFLHG